MTGFLSIGGVMLLVRALGDEVGGGVLGGVLVGVRGGVLGGVLQASGADGLASSGVGG